MGTKSRIIGADAVLLGRFETTYGTAPTTVSTYTQLSFKSFALDSERQLGYDALLGQGRDALDPYYDVINVSGDIGIPMDARNLGFWLAAGFGTDTKTSVHSTGLFTFTGQPTNDTTITLNGTAWTFKASGATGNQTNKGATLAETLTNLTSDLNASTDVQVTKCTYRSSPTVLYLYHEVGGDTGDAFTLAAGTGNATPSGGSLSGGAVTGMFEHSFTSGGTLPSMTLEVGHPQLTTAQYMRYSGGLLNTLGFDMTRSGPANGTVNVIAQGRTDSGTAIDAGPASYELTRFSQGNGSIKLNNTQIANVTAGKVEFSNSLTPVETIRSDGKIDGIDSGEARCTGTMTVRAGTDTALTDAVTNQLPVSVEFSFSHPSGYVFTLYLPRVFLPKPKASITGPGGIEQVYDFQAAKSTDTNFAYLARVTLLNDVSTAYY